MKGESFDEAGYDIDHITELRNGGSNDISNLQALCPTCHRVKTSRNTANVVSEPKTYREISVNGKIIRLITNTQARS
jgi:5-methylcytosine-specific restriction endonuclease McrA